MNCPACRDLGCSGCRLDKPDHEILRIIAVLALIAVVFTGLLSSGCATTLFKKDPLLEVVKTLADALKAQQATPTPTPSPSPALLILVEPPPISSEDLKIAKKGGAK